MKQIIQSIKILLFLFIFLHQHYHGWGQYDNMNFEHLSLKDGLSQITINSMIQDSYGFIWFATQDGLNRYDGVRNKIYRPDLENPEKTIAGSFINYIFEDLNKDIWIATFSGLSRYDREEERFYNFYHDPENENSISNNIIFFVQNDSYNNIWVFTPNGADKLTLSKERKDSVQVIHYSANLGKKSNLQNLTGWTIDKNGDIWLSSNGNGLFRLSKNEQKKEIPEPEQFMMQDSSENTLPSNNLFTIKTDVNGDPWIYSKNTFTKIIAEKGNVKFVNYKVNEGINGNVNGLSFFIDKSGNVMFGVDNSGLFIFDSQKKKLYNYQNETYNPRSLRNNRVNAIVKDNSGVLWIGTANGISKYIPDKNEFKHFEPQPNNPEWLRDPFVFSISVDKYGKYWVGTNNGRGLFVYNPATNKFKNYSVKEGDLSAIPGPFVFSIFKDSEKNMWVGTNNGLSVFDYNTETFKTFHAKRNDTASLVNNIVKTIIEDKNKNLWIGTAFGLNSYNLKTRRFKRWDLGTNINNIGGNIQCMIFDKVSNLWIGTFVGGLMKIEFDGEEKMNITKFEANSNDSNSLRSNQISALLEDKAGNIWIATYGGGLNKFDVKSQQFELYTTKDGLPVDNFYGLVEDNNGNLWFSSSGGLSMYDLNSKKFVNYDINDGLQSNEFNGNSYYKDENGLLFFGGVNGFNVFNPDDITSNSIEPKIILTDFKVKNNSVKPGTKSPLKKSIQTAKVIELRPNQRDFTFEFAAFHYVSPTQNTYAYMMEGYDEEWIDLGTQNFVSFKGFPHGEYIFRVKAANCDGVWNQEGISIKVIIHPPFWATSWFKIVILFVIIGIVWAYIKIRERNLRNEKQRLEKIVAKRTLEIREANEELKQQSEELKAQNEEITTQRDQIEIQHVAITDSIQYAKRIQTAVMPLSGYIDELLPENFILFKPRNVVSGDFYWVRQVNHYIIIAIADCTGHGVPGAIMSMLGISYINEIVQNNEVLQTNEALNELRRRIKHALRQTGKKGETDDGMDMALCALDTKTNILQYAGANCPLYLIQNGEFSEIKADKMPIGYYPNEKPTFTNHKIQLHPTDIFYLFSDGFADQLGGKNALKYKVANFQKTLFENHRKPLLIQKEILEQELDAWRNSCEQTDDILVMGVRV